MLQDHNSYLIIRTTKLVAMTEFYRSTLGLVVRSERENWVEFDAGGFVLALLGVTEPLKVGQNLQIAIHSSTSPKDPPGEGVRLIKEPEGHTNAWLEVPDPDGNRVGLWWRV